MLEYHQFSTLHTHPYRRDDAGESDDQEEIQWEEQMPTVEKPQKEKILKQRVGKKTGRKMYLLIFQNPNPVSVSLIFQPNLNVETPVSALFQHMSQHCFSICHSGVSAYVTALFQHMSQRCFSICYSTVSAYVTAVFQHMLQRCFSI
jgi:hypothetical protein